MRTLGPLLLGLVVGVVAGIGATKLLVDPPVALPRPESGGGPRVAQADDVGRASASDPESASFPVAPPAAERSIAPAVGNAPSAVVDEAIRIARSAPAAARARGDRTIRGRVARADGSGVEGVVMRARRTDGAPREPGRSSVGLAAPASEPLERAIARSIESWYEQAGRRAETTTDRDGRYELAELPAGKWWLEPWCAGFAIDAVVAANEIEPDATVDFTATVVERLPIAVVLPDGSAPPRAAVVLKSGSRNRADVTSLWSPDANELSLRPGTFELRATLGDPEQGPAWPDALASDWTTVTIQAGGAPSPLRLSLRGAPGVRGRITFPPGVARENPLVKLAPAPATGEPDLVALANDGTAMTAWAGQGSYLFRDVTPGRWVVAVSRRWGERIAAHAVVDVRDGMVVQDLAIPPADPSTSLVVKLLDPDGALIEDAEFQLGVNKPNSGSSSQGASAERKPNGNWWVTLGVVYAVDLAKPWPEEVTVSLIVTTPRFGSKTVAVPAGTRALQVRFAAPATLRATIAGYAGSGHEGKLHLSLEPVADGERPRVWSARGGVAADGSQLFGPVESGPWRLKLELQTKQEWNRRRLATLDVVLAPGDNTATIDLPSVSDVVVDSGGRQGGMMLQKIGTDESYHEQVGADGLVTFEAMPPGDYRLQSFGGPMEMMQLRVPTAGVVRFEPMVIDAARVTIRDRDGALAKAGFEDGDLIVGIDGHEFESSMQMQGLLMQSIAKAKIVFDVERGSRRITVDVNPKLLMDPGKQGGTIEPTAR